MTISKSVLSAVTTVTPTPRVLIMMDPLCVHVMMVSLELEHGPVFRIFDLKGVLN